MLKFFQNLFNSSNRQKELTLINVDKPAQIEPSANSIKQPTPEESTPVSTTIQTTNLEKQTQKKTIQATTRPTNTNNYISQNIIAKYKQLETDYNNTLKETTPLVGAEKSFLKYVNNRQIASSLPAYWFYEYGFNTDELLSKLFFNGYLRVSSNTESLKALTIEELKPILQHFNLVQSGKKAELIQRIKDSVSEFELEPFVKNKYSFVATVKGTEIIKNTPESLTKDPDFEDSCLTYILNNDFDNAYKLVCQREINKKSPHGIGIDWLRELQQGLSQNQKQYYQNVINSLKETNIQIKACVVLCEMLGSKQDRLRHLFSRITGKTYDSKKAYTIYYSLTRELSADKVKAEFKSLGVERYQILGEPDCNHYDICAKKNGKVYALSSYKIGKTAPPFHEKCTCTVVPYFDDEF